MTKRSANDPKRTLGIASQSHENVTERTGVAVFARAVGVFITVWIAVFAQACSSESSHSELLQARIAENHRLFAPSGKGPFTTILAVPGCSRIARQSADAEEAITQLTEDDRLFRGHYPRFAKRLSDEGFAVYLIDILTAEGLVKACAEPVPAHRIAEYIDATITWLKARPDVDSSAIHVVGFSMGGWGSLAWLNGPRNEASSVQSVTTVYPGCFDRQPLNIAIPVLMLLGDADDIADPSLCDALVETSPIKDLITVRHYPGARHGFDIQGAPSVLDIGNGMTVGYQKAAADAAWEELVDFIRGSP